MLPEDELAELAEDIKANGLLEPVWTHAGLLLDGRNRLVACDRVGVEPQIREYTGEDPIGFALSLNLRRRHLTTGQKAMLALKVEPLYAEEAARRVGGRPSKPAADRQQVVSPGPIKQRRAPAASDRAASTTGTSGRAVARAKRVSESAPDLAAKVADGALALDRAERIVRDRAAEQKRITAARQEAEAAPEQTLVDIRHGDFRDVLADLTDVDAIITDPPYKQEFLPLLADLAAWADKVLKPDGVLAVLFGQTYLPEVYRLLDGGRPYRWTGCYLAKGQATQVFGRAQVQTMWKPILVYGGGPRFSDLFETGAGNADARNHHEWGQDYGAFHTLVERLTSRGQTVVDPFLGSGTTLLAARALGRHAIGCDIDPAHIETSRRRLT